MFDGPGYGGWGLWHALQSAFMAIGGFLLLIIFLGLVVRAGALPARRDQGRRDRTSPRTARRRRLRMPWSADRRCAAAPAARRAGRTGRCPGGSR